MTDNQKPFVWQMTTGGPETYEKYIVPVWMAEWAPDLIQAGGVGPKKQVLDVACGTGIVARKAAGLVGPGGRVAGIDANEGMLRVAGKCAEAECCPNIEWHRGDVTRMPFSPGEFDTVLCQQGLQFFPDRPAALKEMARVLAPGGRLALCVWGRFESSPLVVIMSDVLGRYLGQGSTAMFQAACSLADCGKLRTLVQNAGFTSVHIRVDVKVARHPSLEEFLPAYLSIFPVAAEIAAMQEETRARMFSEMAVALLPWRDDDGLVIPTENHILTAQSR
ncbi:MAG: methyltransferase domain-containing protein [Methanoregula sp.]|nr:methyltransferase domain-containing protein [Methanoregula sp.]